jgi:hypothetical protein
MESCSSCKIVNGKLAGIMKYSSNSPGLTCWNYEKPLNKHGLMENLHSF